MERHEALRRILFLKSVPDDVIAAIGAAGEERHMGRGELLFAENSPCLGMIVVLAGAVKIYKLDHRGRELTLGSEKPGGSVAELPLFDGGNYPASAEAAEDETVVLIVSRERFFQIMASHPQLAEQALRALAVRTRKLVLMIEAQTLHSVRQRLAAYLIRASHGRSNFDLAETNEAIASKIGTVRDVVSRTLSSFKDAGMIAVNRRDVTIIEREALSRVASSGEGP